MKIRAFLYSCGLLAALPLWAYDPPTMGWSSWNTYRVNINDELICKQADAMKSTGLQDVGYRYINIDDGFFGGRDDDGRLITHPDRFPNGLKKVVDYIHSLGFKAGIYSDAGRNTCGSYWDGDKKGIGVGMYEHDQQDADFYFKDMGFDFIKVDFCGGDPGQNFDKLDLDERERYTAIRAAIDATGRKDVRMNVCRWAFPGSWVHDVASSWRISADINASWASVAGIIKKNLYLSAYAGEGRYNDMDMLEIGRGLPVNEEQAHFGMWCMMSSPLLIGCDMTKIPAASLKLVSNPELIAINQDSLGLQARVIKVEKNILWLVKDVEELQGNVRVLALYNPTTVGTRITLRGSDVGLGGKVLLRDVMERKDLAELTENNEDYTIRVPGHGICVLRLEGETRMEETRYEAEWAWLNQYQEIWNSGNQIRYTETSGLSAGAKVGYLGNGAENWMEWRDVYSAHGGNYVMNIHFISGENRAVTLTVNGGEPQTLTGLNSGSWSGTAQKAVNIQLKPGYNTIRLGNAAAWAPDIDCMTLTHIPTSVDPVKAKEGRAASVKIYYDNKPVSIYADRDRKVVLWDATRKLRGTRLFKKGYNTVDRLEKGIYLLTFE